jgi:2-keto-4-pentenoate hydratase
MTIEDGYAIQREWVKLELASGRSIKGRKIGLTSRAMQQASQIDEPDYAPLMDDMFFAADSDLPLSASSRRASKSSWRSPGQAVEGPDVTLDEVLAATEYVARQSRSSTPASSSSTARPRRCARCSTPSATLRPTPASSLGPVAHAQ